MNYSDYPMEKTEIYCYTIFDQLSKIGGLWSILKFVSVVIFSFYLNLKLYDVLKD